jgi:hypothetical protein
MKKNDRIKRDAEEMMGKIRSLIRHKRNVEDNCLLLGEKLIERGEFDLGRHLIANADGHDTSKFYGIEFENLSSSTSKNTPEENAKLKMRLAIQHHVLTNQHHPEYWNGIKNMPRVAVAEMVADWKARSEEFGTSVREWIDDQATKRWKFSKDDEVYKTIMDFVDLLCQKPFENTTHT